MPKSLPALLLEMNVKRHSLYFMGDKSRQEFFFIVGGDKDKNKICLPADVGGGKNKTLIGNDLISSENRYFCLF